ncbi:MAG: hypothetical protein U1G05_06725 [Kiritimatiellia bacterium]
MYFHVQDGYFSDGGVSSGAQDDYSAQPYSVRVDFIPAKDAGEPNDGHDTARVLQPGETAEGTIFPRGDQDYFRLALPAGKQGVLEIRLDGMPDNLFPHLRVDDVSRRRLDDLEKTVDRGQSAVWTRNVASGGDFFLIVRDGALDGRGRESWDGSASLQPLPADRAVHRGRRRPAGAQRHDRDGQAGPAWKAGFRPRLPGRRQRLVQSGGR